MNCEHLIKAIGDINEKYILEYANIYEIKKVYSKKYLKQGMGLVACLVLIIASVFTLPMLNLFENQTVKMQSHYFDSYSQFVEVLPENNLLKNISLEKFNEVDFIGNCNVGNNDYYDTKNYSSFEMVLSKDNITSEIVFTPNSNKDVKSIAENQSLFETITIDTTIVYYSYNIDEEYYEALFMYDSDLYDVRLEEKDENKLFNLIEDMIK